MRCLESVYRQTVPVRRHLIAAEAKATDQPRPVAIAQAQNALLAGVDTEWVLRLADDDELTENAVELLLAASEGADVVYGPDRDGQAGVTDVSGMGYGALCRFMEGADTGEASGTLMRTEFLRKIGGFVTNWRNGHFHHPWIDVCLHYFEDRATRQVLAMSGATFRMAAGPVWVAGLDGPDRVGSLPVPRRQC